MRLGIRHETHYEYSAPLQYALQQKGMEGMEWDEGRKE